MKFSASAFCFALTVHGSLSFSIAPTVVSRDFRAHTCSASRLFATLEAPPTDTEEVYGTVVGDTKGAELRLADVAISRGEGRKRGGPLITQRACGRVTFCNENNNESRIGNTYRIYLCSD